MAYYNSSPSQQPKQNTAQRRSGDNNGNRAAAVTTADSEGEEVIEYKHHPQPYILREDEKIPLFLVKLWNIVEDPAYYDVIRWDDSGYSFHITDPYSFCRNVLPQYFKHNNLNNGFRKMTPIERTSLARAESDQDHLEFSHPFFVRDHPELLVNIKRKVSISRQNDYSTLPSTNKSTGTSSKDFSGVFEELSNLRERQKNMEMKMTDLVKENELIWQEMSHMRGAHMKQQQIVNKLVQFLVALMQPSSKQPRLGKRQLLAIDDARALDSKRSRDSGSWKTVEEDSQGAIVQQNNSEMLDRLMEELSRGQMFGGTDQLTMRAKRLGSESSGGSGPIIAEVTDDFDHQLSATNPQISQSQQQQQSYSAYVDKLNRQQRYPVRSNRGYAGVKGGRIQQQVTSQAPSRGTIAAQRQRSVSDIQPTPQAAVLVSPSTPLQAPALMKHQQLPMESPPRYFTRHYHQQQMQQNQPSQLQYEKSAGLTNAPLLVQQVQPPMDQQVTRAPPQQVTAPRAAFPITRLQRTVQPPMVMRPQVGATTQQPVMGTQPIFYSPVTPDSRSGGCTINEGMEMRASLSDPLMNSTIQPDTLSSPIAEKSNMDMTMTEDEFNEYLNQNDLAISNLRNNFGNIWDWDDLLDLNNDPTDPNHLSSGPSSNEANNQSSAGSPYLENENGNAGKSSTLSPLSNVPTATPMRNSKGQDA